MKDKIAQVTHAGELALAGVTIPCYVTKDGIRVLSGRGMQDSLRLVDEDTAQKSGSRLGRLFGNKTLKPLIFKDNSPGHFEPIVCTFRGKQIHGYKAEVLADICEAMLQARDQDLLSTPRQRIIAQQCDVLMRAFARVGITALVDEATGYQDVRPKQELQKILEAYISKELLPWTKRFPDAFYEELFRLRGWQFNPVSVKRPILVGKLTEDIVYKRLPPGVLDDLKSKNPKNEKGRRKHKHHQFLTEDIGNPHLEKHIASVTTLMRISPNWRKFESYLRRAFPIPHEQRNLLDEIESIEEGDFTGE